MPVGCHHLLKLYICIYLREKKKIEYLRLKNFKTFHNVEVKEIPRFCVVVGANGSGKSTLFMSLVF